MVQGPLWGSCCGGAISRLLSAIFSDLLIDFSLFLNLIVISLLLFKVLALVF